MSGLKKNCWASDFGVRPFNAPRNGRERKMRRIRRRELIDWVRIIRGFTKQEDG